MVIKQRTKHFFLNVALKFAFTLWRDVREGNLYEALQAQKDHTSVDDKPQKLPRFT